MKIEKIEIAGFGKLRNLTKEKALKLAPGINVFFGRNGAGKSTLQQAILALLYGFYEGSRATTKEKERWEKFHPWQGSSYAGALEYVLDDGRRFRVERNFEPGDIPTRVLDLTTGQDITSSFGLGRHGNVPFARKQLGMPCSVFISSAFISQGATKQFEETRPVGDTIVSLADTGKRDISAEKAKERLDKNVRQDIGTDRSRTTPLAKTRRDLEEACDELRKYREAKESVQAAAKEREDLSEELDQKRQELQKVDFCIISRQLGEVEDRLSRIEQQDQSIAKAKAQLDKFKQYANFPKDSYEEVIKGKQSLNDASKHLGELQEIFEEKKSQLDKINAMSEYEALGKTMNQLSDSEYGDLQGIQQRLNQFKQDIEEKEQSLAALEARRIPIKPWMIVLAILLPPIGIPLLLRYRCKVKRSIEKEKAEVRQGLANLVADQKGIAIRQEYMLSKYEAKSMEELEKKRLRYFQLGNLVSDQVNLQGQINQAKQQVETAREGLIRIFQRARIDERDYNKASALFDEGYAGRLRYDEAEQASKSAESQKCQILGMQSSDEVKEIQGRLRQQKDALLASNPRLAGLSTDKSLDQLNEERDALDKKRGELKEEISKREERITIGLEGHRDGADIEEDLAQYQKEVEGLELYRNSLELARKEIEATAEEVHRDFAPQLAKAVGERIARITDGYYNTVYIDPSTLSITINEPEINKLLPTGSLSFGTEEQIYLLLRVQLAQLMSNLHERIPLLLDAPFTYSDPLRLRRVLNVLLDLSRENQILLFSEDIDIVRWFRSSLTKDAAHHFFLVHINGSVVNQNLLPMK